jgi:ATP-dependent Clp protease protease subunit
MKLNKFPKKPEDWYSIQGDAGSYPAEVYIHGFIGRNMFGEGVAPEDLIADVKGLKLKARDELHVRINSKGGDYFDGNTIYNYLSSLKQKVVVTVDGLAASAASIIAMAGDVVRIPENGFIMIHNPHTAMGGESKDFRKMADELDKMRDAAVATYQAKVGEKVSGKKIINMMDESTWMNAAQSMDLGFADEMIFPVRAAAFVDMDLQEYFDNVPGELVSMQKDERMKRAQQRADVKKLNDWNVRNI